MNAILSELRSRVRQTLDPLIPSGSSCALIDFPNYANVGDSAIWLGEIAYLKSRGCRIRYVCDTANYDPSALVRAIGRNIILLQGGGNFGDLYPSHQKFRERVISDFPDNRIIQLPQSIHFADIHHLSDSSAALSKHKDFHLAVRDPASLSIAQENFSTPTCLCPDMGVMLDITDLRSTPKHANIVVLSRTDKEKMSSPSTPEAAAPGHFMTDWMEESTPRMEWLYDWAHRRLGWGSSKIPPFLLNKLALVSANFMARERLARGLDILSHGNTVITDRLHAVILSWLGGLPVMFIDNNYKKLSNFVDTWLDSGEAITRHESFDEAIRLATGTPTENNPHRPTHRSPEYTSCQNYPPH